MAERAVPIGIEDVEFFYRIPGKNSGISMTGYRQIIKYGIYFYKKECMVKAVVCRQQKGARFGAPAGKQK